VIGTIRVIWRLDKEVIKDEVHAFSDDLTRMTDYCEIRGLALTSKQISIDITFDPPVAATP
jgi:hypothetical protein